MITFATTAHAQVSDIAIERVVKALDAGDNKALQIELNKLSKVQRTNLLKALRVDTRIVGGFAADVSDFPWQVALVRGSVNEPRRSQFCGGTIIAPDLVITAAHCIDNFIVRSDAALVNVVAGASAFEAGGQRVKVRQIYIHPQWNAKAVDFDVALLRLDSLLSVGRPVALARTSPSPSTKAWVSGWGATAEGSNGSPILLAADVPIVSRDVCNAPESYNNTVTAQMLCAGERDGGKDACQGDSGGPLVTGAANNERLVGIVSKGDGCARELKYGIYTDVASIADWVTSITGAGIRESEPRMGEGLFALPSQSKLRDR